MSKGERERERKRARGRRRKIHKLREKERENKETERRRLEEEGEKEREDFIVRCTRFKLTIEFLHLVGLKTLNYLTDFYCLFTILFSYVFFTVK